MGCPCDTLAQTETSLSPVCLGHLWMFNNLAPSELEVLISNAARRKVDKGRFIFTQGDPSGEMFLLKSGRVKLTKILENGSEITLDIRKAGDFIGENVLTGPGDYPVNAVCMDTSLTCGFSREQLENLILTYPNIGLQIIKNMSERISLLTSKVGSLATTSIEDRLYSVLRHVAGEHGTPGPEGRVIQFPLTHEDLGFLIGAHRVSITRAMKYLKETGKIGEAGRFLVIPGEDI